MYTIDIPKLGRIYGFVMNFVLCFVSLLICSIVPIGKTFIWLIALAKFFAAAIYIYGYIYTVEFYPTKIRATGLGVAAV